MPRLPDKTDLGGIPSGGSRSPVILSTPDVGGDFAVGQEIAKGVAKIGATVQAKQDEADDYEVQKALVQFDLDQEKRLDDAKRNAPPEARDFTTQYRSGYDAAAGQLMQRIPDRLKPKVDAALVKRGATFEKRAYDFELAERDRWNVDDVTRQTSDLITGTMTTPDSMEDNAGRGVSIIRASRLTPRAKLEAERKFLDQNAEFGIKSMIDRDIEAGRDATEIIQKLRRVPKGYLAGQASPAGAGAGPRFGTEVDGIIERTATETGVDPAMLRVFARIESGGKPDVKTGSYKGLFQLSDAEFKKHGGSGNIFDPEANAKAAAIKLKAESDAFERRVGRAPTPAELYLVHQQGEGGAAAHAANPDRAAWENMASTAEGRSKGSRWAKQAIWGNIPDADKRRFGSVENVTSADFVKLWTDKVERFSKAGSAAPDKVERSELPEPGAAAPANADGRATLVKDGATADAPQAEPEFEEADDGGWGYMSPTTRRKLLNYARTAGRASIAKSVDADISRLRDGRKPTTDEAGRTSLDRAKANLTPLQYREVEKKWREAEFEVEEFNAIRRMPTEQAFASWEDMVARAEERARSQGKSQEEVDATVAAASNVQRRLKAQVERLVKQRESDPAAAVIGSRGDGESTRTPPHPAILEAARAIKESQAQWPGDRGASSKPDTSARAVQTTLDGQRVNAAVGTVMPEQQQWKLMFEARLKAQDDFETDENRKRILTKSEAVRLLGLPSAKGTVPDDKRPEQAYRQRLEDAAKRARQMFPPEYADRALRDAIALTINTTNSDKQSLHANLIAKLAKGEPITSGDVRPLREIESVDAVSLSAGMDAMARVDRAGRDVGMPQAAPMGDPGRPAIGQGVPQPSQKQVEWLKADPSGRYATFAETFGQNAAAQALLGAGGDAWGKSRAQDKFPRASNAADTMKRVPPMSDRNWFRWPSGN